MLSHTSRTLSRVASASLRPSLLSLTSRRSYANPAEQQSEPVPSHLLSLSLYLPHAPVFTNRPVSLVTIPGASGYMGIAKNHMPVIAELKPGVVTVDEPGKPQEKYFVSGGFAYVQTGNLSFCYYVL